MSILIFCPILMKLGILVEAHVLCVVTKFEPNPTLCKFDTEYHVIQSTISKYSSSWDIDRAADWIWVMDLWLRLQEPFCEYHPIFLMRCLQSWLKQRFEVEWWQSALHPEPNWFYYCDGFSCICTVKSVEYLLRRGCTPLYTWKMAFKIILCMCACVCEYWCIWSINYLYWLYLGLFLLRWLAVDYTCVDWSVHIITCVTPSILCLYLLFPVLTALRYGLGSRVSS